MALFILPSRKTVSSGCARAGLLIACISAALLISGCSNFDRRQRYWDEQLAGKLKAAPLYRLKSFAQANGHQLTCDGDGVSREGTPDLSECYFVDSRSKGALFNYRGKLFVMIKMSNGQVKSHTFTTSTVLY